MDQEKGSPAAVQESPYHSTLIPGTSAASSVSMVKSSALLMRLSWSSQ